MFAPATLALLALPAGIQAPPQPTALAAHHHSGQTFLTWQEASHEDVALYRIYRHDAPVDALCLVDAELIGEVPQDSSLFYADRYFKAATVDWEPRYLERYVIVDGGPELAAGTGLFVWTPSVDDFDGLTEGATYYAITSVDLLGVENDLDFTTDNTLGPLAETVDDPLPVFSTTMLDGKCEIYTQFLDVRDYNATLAAPNSYNDWYGLDETDFKIANAIQYAFTYAIFVPYPGCIHAGEIEGLHPVVLNLHGHGGEKARPWDFDPNATWCNAFRVHPIDPVNAWWFGHARGHDYRQDLVVTAGDTVENYTEARVLRMLHDLARHPTYGPKIDMDRVFVYGHSMGGSGALAMALRYPNVFAAAHASQPMTDYLTSGDAGGSDWRADVSVKLGAIELDLPIAIAAPAGWADHLAPHVGTPAWYWQNHQAQIAERRADEIVPLGLDHSTIDNIIEWETQGKPAYAPIDGSARCWRGKIQSMLHLPSNIAAMPGPFRKNGNGLPFMGFAARRSETVPALADSSLNPGLPPDQVGEYNASIDWSAGWAEWDGAPIDEPERWRISLRTDTESPVVVDVTPRRMQAFVAQPQVPYVWRNDDVASATEVASGIIFADEDGLLTVDGVVVSEDGNRVELRPMFSATPGHVSLAKTGSQTMALRAGSEHAGAFYLVLGSASGSAPGLPLHGNVTLPLVFDAYTQLTAVWPNSPVLQPSLAALDAFGEATCTFTLPPALPAGLAGLTLHHAFIVLDEFGIAFASNAVPLVFEP